MMKCKKHPRYKGIYRPKAACKKCLQIYTDKKTAEDCGEVEKLLKFMRSMEVVLISDFVFRFNGRTFTITPGGKNGIEKWDTNRLPPQSTEGYE